MDNQAYFKKYLESCEIIAASDVDNMVYIKDMEHRYQFMSKLMLDLVGRKDFLEVKNKTFSEIAEGSTLPLTFVETMKKQDNNIIKTRSQGMYLVTAPYNKMLKLLLVIASPIINPHTGDMLGTHGYMNNLIWPSIIKALFNVNGTKGGLLVNKRSNGDPLAIYPINNRQHSVLFLCLNNYSYSEIALLMNELGHDITPVRVNDYLEQLKLIFHVRTKTQLIEKAIGLNFHALIPCELFKDVSSIDIKHEIAEIICCNCKLNMCTEHVTNI
jgi:DNA-binding CsgD family transcriptional regulator